MTPTFSRGKLPSDELEKFQLPRISRQLPKKIGSSTKLQIVKLFVILSFRKRP